MTNCNREKPFMAQSVPARKSATSTQRNFLPLSARGRSGLSQEANNLLQGDAADTVFYNQTGKVRLTVVSKIGKEATLGEPEIKRRR